MSRLPILQADSTVSSYDDVESKESTAPTTLNHITKEFEEFSNQSTEDKLNRLMFLVQKSKVYSGILADRLQEHEVQKLKRKQDAEENPNLEKRPRLGSSRKSKRVQGRKGQTNIMDLLKRAKEEREYQEIQIKDNKENTSNLMPQPYLLKDCTMRPYQLEGTEWLITLYENGLNGILADEMGLGKTIQSIAFLCFLIEKGIKGPFLIVGPLSTIANWKNEFKRFAPDLNILLYHGTKEERKQMLKDKLSYKKSIMPIVITSYEIILRDKFELSTFEWSYLIVDEGHRLKNMNCLLIKILKSLNSLNRLILTGTPLQNNLNELWSLLNFILPDVFQDLNIFQQWFDFSKSNINSKKKDQNQNLFNDGNVKEDLVSNLHAILKPFILRRLKKDVIKDLVSKRELVIYGRMTDTQYKLYDMFLTKKNTNLIKRHLIEVCMKDILITMNINNGNESKITIDDINDYLKKNVDNVDNLRLRKRRVYENESKSESEFESESESENKNEQSQPQVVLSLKDQKIQKLYLKSLKQISSKKLQNPLMQLRLICDSPYLFYYPWLNDNETIDERVLKTSGKLQLLNQLVPKLISTGHKILIFCQFVEMMDILDEWATDLNNWKTCRIDGSMAQSERQEQIESFSNNKNYNIFLLSTRAGGLGINLTAADTVIMFDSDWNPQQDLQAMDRAHRIGQEKPVNVYRLVMSNSVEQLLLERANDKLKLEHVVIGMGDYKFDTLKRGKKKVSVEEEEDANVILDKLQGLLKEEKERRRDIVDNVIGEKELNELLRRIDI